MINASFTSFTLKFNNPSGTSRGVLLYKKTYFIIIKNENNWGVGEAGLFEGLSYEDTPKYTTKLQWVCDNIHLGLEELLLQTVDYPSIQIGLEMAFLSLHTQDSYSLFPSDFTKAKDKIKINGLIWMGDKSFMKEQIKTKIGQGFSCVKLKIGAIDFKEELALLQYIRNEYTSQDIQLRVDANGAFNPKDALDKLKRLSDYDLHSIEQPIRQGQWEAMSELCQQSPLPIALDEELIGIRHVTNRNDLLQTIQPQFIILKPTLVGGFKNCKDWISIAEKENIGYWVTSALESNVGLSAIAQFTYTLGLSSPQGLGTGALYSNNIESPLEVIGQFLSYNPQIKWENIFEKLTK